MIHEMSFNESFSRHKKFLFFLFIVSFFLRAVIFVCYLGKNENFWQVDSQTYHLTAQQISQGNGIVSEDGSPLFYRLPGYPIFLGFFYRILGTNKKNALWPQMVLASTIPLLVFFLSLTLFPTTPIIAQCASLWTSIHLGFVLYAGFFMTESIFIFFFLLFLLFFLSAHHLFFCRKKSAQPQNNTNDFHAHYVLLFPESSLLSESYVHFCQKCDAQNWHHKKSYEGDKTLKALFWAGLFLGLASLFRPVGHYLLVLSTLILLFSHDSLRQKIIKIITLASAWILPVSFWLVRNFVLTSHLFFHTLPGGHFLYLSAARVAMHTQNCSYQEAREHLFEEVHKNMVQQEKDLGRPLLEIEKCNAHEQLAITYFKKYPLITLKNWCTDMVRSMLSLYSAELVYLESGRKSIDYFKKGRSMYSMFERYLFPQDVPWQLKGIIWGEIALFLFMLLGFLLHIIATILAAIKRNFEPLCVLGRCVPFMVLFVVIALSGGYARMRLPIEPLLIIFSTAGWINKHRNKESAE